MSNLEGDIQNLNEGLNQSYNFLSIKAKNFYSYLRSQNINFFVKWIMIFITVCIYVICLVLFLITNQHLKAKMLFDFGTSNTNNIQDTQTIWYSFLFEPWYFVPMLTITFACIIWFIFKINFYLTDLFLLIAIYVLFTLSIYYSYNNTVSSNLPVIMYGVTLLITVLFIIFTLNMRKEKLITLLLLPLLIMIGFGIFLGVEFAMGNLNTFLPYDPEKYALSFN
jgi:hypothetical protein